MRHLPVRRLPRPGTVLTLKFEALQESRTQVVLQGGYISGAKDAKLQSTATLLVECPASRFTDVDRNEYYHEGIDFVVSRGYMIGMGGAKFQPNTEMSRAMLVTVLYRIAGEPPSRALHRSAMSRRTAGTRTLSSGLIRTTSPTA